MPGLHTAFSSKNRIIPALNKLDFLLYDRNFQIKKFVNRKNVLLAATKHKSYPITSWRFDNIEIVLDGIIYNFSQSEVRRIVNKIAQAFQKNRNIRKLIKDFVKNTDGDYIIQLYSVSDKRYIIFNDYLGRLPLYYYCTKNLCLLSKEQKFILHFIPNIIFNKEKLLEYLLYEFPLGNKTIVQNVFRLEPCQLIEINGIGNEYIYKIEKTADFNFTLSKPYQNKKDSIRAIKSAFLKATKDRLRTFHKMDFEIIADLSGGYDTRTVLGGLSKYTQNISYITYEYVQDESRVAEKLFRSLGSPGKYRKMHSNNIFSETEAPELVYRFDASANYLTTVTCYNESLNLLSSFPNKTARFSGLGGEFIRHPYKYKYLSLPRTIMSSPRSSLPLKLACGILKYDDRQYRDNLSNYFKKYPEKNTQGRLKRLYYEYYNHYVGASAEERERNHFWTTHPLWSNKFIQIVYNKIPLRWVGYPYYIEFLKNIDPKLTRISIFGSNIVLNSHFSVWKYAVKDSLRVKMYYFANNRVFQSIIGKMRTRFYRNTWRKAPAGKVDDIPKKILSYKLKLRYTKDIIDIDALIGLPRGKHDLRALTLLIYFHELEKKYGDKLSQKSSI